MTPAQFFLMGACRSLCGCGLFGGVDSPPLEVVPHVDIGRYAPSKATSLLIH